MGKLILGPKAQREAARFIDWLVLQGVGHGLAAEAVQKFALTIAGKKAPDADAPAASMVTEYLRTFQALYFEKYREMPVIQPKDYINAGKLLRQYGTTLCLQRLRDLAASTDPFHIKAGFTISTLVAQWNRLTATAASAERRTSAPAAPSDCRHTPPCRNAIEHNQRALRDLRTSPSAGTMSPRPIT
jgi:hypothetical protein